MSEKSRIPFKKELLGLGRGLAELGIWTMGFLTLANFAGLTLIDQLTAVDTVIGTGLSIVTHRQLTKATIK